MNAKEEFLEHTKGKTVICAIVNETPLPFNYTPFELVRFLGLIHFDYHAGYGGQELEGTIWYDDGTWSDRGEYDGSEWWDYNECPLIPTYLIK